MRNQENKITFTAEAAIDPLVECGINFKDQRLLLHEMFATAVSNAPDDETDNFTAKKLKPFYLALCEVLENLSYVPDLAHENIMSSMSNI